MKRSLILFTTLLSLHVFAQKEDIDLEAFAERLFQVQDEQINYEDMYESLLMYYTNPLNLNKVRPEQLGALYLLSPTQIHHFFEYKEQFGHLLSLHELQAIPGFDLRTIQNLRPFVTIEESYTNTDPLWQRIRKEDNNYLLLRFTRTLEKQTGFTPPLPLDTGFVRNELNEVIDTLITPPRRYLGSPYKVYGRFRTSRPGDFSLGFTFEKDAGERVAFDKNQFGFDFYSYHFMLENKLGFERIILGDYQIQAGQSLALGAGFTSGKGAETVNAIKRNTLGPLPYTSALEDGFFRGISLTKSVGDFHITTFYSNLRNDGNLRSDTTFSGFDEFVNSIQRTGLHRTSNELSIKDQLSERSYGAVVAYRPHQRLSIGLSRLHTQYSSSIQPRPTTYNQFEFTGDDNHISSSFFHYTWQNFTFFGEGALSKSGGFGAIGGFVTSLSPAIDMALVRRNYDRDFHSFYGNALSEASRNINEKGSYWGLSIHPGSKHSIKLYYDTFQFPWLRYRTEAPSAGNEWLIRYAYRATSSVHLHVQARQQLRQVTLSGDNLNVLTDQVRNNYQFNINYELNNQLSLKTKIQSSTQNQGGSFSKGFAIIQDLNFKLCKLKFNTRLALFDTDNFNNAQYVYENDVLYSFSIPAYNGTGVRSYFMARYDPSDKVSLWLRYSQFSFRNVDTVGSGPDLIHGNTSSEIKIMTRVKF